MQVLADQVKLVGQEIRLPQLQHKDKMEEKVIVLDFQMQEVVVVVVPVLSE